MRKYFTEIGLSLVTEGSAVFRPSVMQHLDKISDVTHGVLDDASIYFLCAKPRVRIKPESIRRVSNDLKYDLVLSKEDKTVVETTTVPNFFALAEEIEMVQPNRDLTFCVDLVRKDGRESTYLPVDMLIHPDSFPGHNVFAYEVLYVGQSQVGKTTGNIISRLRNHSTLQKILANMHANTPHLEPFILCFVMDPPRYVMHMDPQHQAQTTDDEDLQHILRAYFNPPTSAQITSIAEAAYIRYFRPRYNRLLRDSFPSTNLKLLETCYDLDFIALSAEVNTEDLDGPLYSEAQKPRYHHVASFELHTPEQRGGFFHLSIHRDGLMVDLQGSDDQYLSSLLDKDND